MSVVLLEQDSIHYEVLGRGRPVIFLHGWVGSWRYWIPVMQAASVSYRAYALDLYGFGETVKNRQRYSLAQQVHLVDAFLEQMGMMKVALVGHGLGALVAYQYAQQHSDLVDRVMLAGCPMEESMISSKLRTSPPADLADWLVGRTSPQAEPVRTDALKTDLTVVQASLMDLSKSGLGDLWKKSATACLLVNGDKDLAVQSPRLEQIAEMPENMHLVNFELSGHFPMLDETTRFNRLMIDFLTLGSGISPRELQMKEEWKRRVR